MPHSQKISASTSAPSGKDLQTSISRDISTDAHDDNQSKRLPLKKRKKLNSVADEETPSLNREPVRSPADTEKGRALTEQEGESSLRLPPQPSSTSPESDLAASMMSPRPVPQILPSRGIWSPSQSHPSWRPKGAARQHPKIEHLNLWLKMTELDRQRMKPIHFSDQHRLETISTGKLLSVYRMRTNSLEREKSQYGDRRNICHHHANRKTEAERQEHGPASESTARRSSDAQTGCGSPYRY
ncbi:hypothetical protein BJP41_04430 [Candidatus Williamhamiltonella defendens]|uniref:Uncharacterized protein n=2 Tax=Candidatus Williamhamiltonella defendens TaxID=138072 RepID=A0A2D3T2H4_9ENTR|nr:hypothetical protein [Candidatus Hamiltonella defensa]ATW29711.1 hypothetical protein BJP41_04430 [Candidatus Hamiltonella defensa]ATW31692.1 hypothetical protein BJP42_04515 [Candidatus Hamiltonella defensa]